MLCSLPPTYRELMAAASRPPESPSPAPHARKRPDITISMLEALKRASVHPSGMIEADWGVCKGLIRRGLARTSAPRITAFITPDGLLLIQTQYEALKKVLPETRAMYK